MRATLKLVDATRILGLLTDERRCVLTRAVVAECAGAEHPALADWLLCSVVPAIATAGRRRMQGTDKTNVISTVEPQRKAEKANTCCALTAGSRSGGCGREGAIKRSRSKQP